MRHANGRDWWIVAQKYLSNRYHFALFSLDGFSNHHQDIGTKETQIGIWGAKLAFSPDGSKLARFDGRHGLDVFDFDRCNGTLSNWRHAFFPGAEIELLAGLSWSADSQYLYASNNLVVRQIDTWSNDLQASAVVVAEAVFPSPSCGNSGGSLGWMELGPDGILYSRPYNGQPCVHRIEHPECAGLACDYQQDYLVLETAIRAFPHFPNFRLGPIDGSACDTLGIDNVPLAGWRHDVVGGLQADFTSVSWYEPESWYWDFGDPASGSSNYSTERHPTHQFSASGTYQVCLTVSNANGSDTKCKNIWMGLSAANQPMDGSRISFYPNPARETLYWQGLPIGQEARVQLWDLHGRLVHEDMSSRAETRLPSSLPSGIYVARLLDAASGRVPYVRKVAVW